MAIISSFCLFIVGVIGAAMARMLAEDFKEWAPFIVEKLIQLVLSKLPAEQQDRFAEEWRSYVNDVSGQIAKLWVAVGFNLVVLMIAESRLKTVYFGIKRKLPTINHKIRALAFETMILSGVFLVHEWAVKMVSGRTILFIDFALPILLLI